MYLNGVQQLPQVVQSSLVAWVVSTSVATDGTDERRTEKTLLTTGFCIFEIKKQLHKCPVSMWGASG